MVPSIKKRRALPIFEYGGIAYGDWLAEEAYSNVYDVKFTEVRNQFFFIFEFLKFFEFFEFFQFFKKILNF